MITLNIKTTNLSGFFFLSFLHSVVFHSIYAFDHFNRYLLRTDYVLGIVLGTVNSATRKQSPYSFFPCWVQELRTKRKRKSNGEWMESEGVHTGVWGLCSEGLLADLGRGAPADLERLLLTEGGGVQGPRGGAQGVQDKEAGEQSWVRMRGVRAEPEQEEPWGHFSKGGRGGLTKSWVFKESLLCFA